MCINPNEHMLVAKRGRKRPHENAVECYYDRRKCLRFVFYPEFWEKFGRFVGMNDYVRFFADSNDLTYVRMQAQPVKGEGCYKMSKRAACKNLRQIILPSELANGFPRHEGRKALAVREEQRSIILSFQ